MLIFWAAFPSVLPGGGRALEISIVAGGGCFEWFPSVNQIPQNTRMIQDWVRDIFFCLGFFFNKPKWQCQAVSWHEPQQGLRRSRGTVRAPL